MTVQQMLNSLPILQRIIELKLPLKKSFKVYSLVKIINEQREFFMKEEQKLISKFNAEVLENGNIKFATAEDHQQFAEEHFNLMQYEIENLEPIDLTFDDLGDSEFSPKELMMLEGVINFID